MAHPLHPVLVHFPIACWSLASLADFAGEQWAQQASLLIGTGIAFSIPAIFTGLMEMGKIVPGTQAQSVVMKHMFCILVAWTSYAISLYLRYEWQDNADYLPTLFSALGFVFLVIAGWYGGRLVYTLGVGVNKEKEES